jgi:CheY-like chemotaxis protein
MSSKTATVLLAARELDPMFELRSRLESAGVQVLTAVRTSEVLDRLREDMPHVVVLDQDLDPASTEALLFTIRTFIPPPELILLTSAEPPVHELPSGFLYRGPRPTDEGALFGRIRDSLRARGLSFTAPAREVPVVLCVDDDALQLSSLSRLLTRHGYRVVACESSARALSSVMDVRPDAAVVDILMPGSGGFDLVERLNRRSGGRIPVVLLTALNTSISRRAAADLGIRHYLTKPTSDQEVLAAVESSLAASERG